MTDNKNITTANIRTESEESFERTLRPKTFEDVIGRKKEKKSLQIMIDSAKKRNRPLDHIIFHGPPGLGKTTLAMVIANSLNAPIHVTSGSAIEKTGDLAAILTSIEEHSVLFIDEIHRMRRTLEEILYPAMEDQALDIVIGKGPSAKTLRLDLAPFTIIGATTKLSSLSAPLRDRFGMHIRLDFYPDDELTELVKQKADMLGIGISDDAAEAIAVRARATARIAIRILKRVRDVAIVNGKDSIDTDSVEEALEILGIDSFGLNETDKQLMHNMLHHFDNKAVGLNTLAASISEEPDTIEHVYEPFLLKKGFIKRTPRGRMLTQKAIDLVNSELHLE